VHYLIRSNVEPLGTGEKFGIGEIAREIDRLSGRNIAPYILTRAIPNRYKGAPDRAYVACAKDAPGRAMHGWGFIVELIR
jgi:hypothetical protein